MSSRVFRNGRPLEPAPARFGKVLPAYVGFFGYLTWGAIQLFRNRKRLKEIEEENLRRALRLKKGFDELKRKRSEARGRMNSSV